MNKTKMLFMQNAPNFVVVGGFSALVLFASSGLLICFTNEWKFGIYATLLCIMAIGFLVYTIKRFERNCKTTISDAMAQNKEYWQNNDK